MPTPTLFELPSAGTCIYCLSEGELVVKPTITPDDLNERGVCDVCSYALGREWRRARGEKIGASSPALVRTYVLVPRLPKGRVAEDVSAYEFLVNIDGHLPSVARVATSEPRGLAEWLVKKYGVQTWDETTRPCYLGYDGAAELSEARLAWAWGRDLVALGEEYDGELVSKGGQKFASFSDLLSKTTVAAGFYLGIKQAFEGLLARRELDPDNYKLCTVLREGAMRYLRAQHYCLVGSVAEAALEASPREAPEHDVVEFYHSSLSSEELHVVSVLAAAEEAWRESQRKPAAPAATQSTGGEETGSEKEIREGFARPTIETGGDES